jgi:DNA-binding winged helix-turn-helix (wHTH) protein/tetratricopeptide (TPR) repeat protein
VTTRRYRGAVPPPVLAFGAFTLDPGARRLLRDGVVVPVQPLTFAFVHLLASAAGRFVTHHEVERTLWPDTAVVPNALRQVVKRARTALGESADAPVCLEARPRSGWRLQVPVRVLPDTVDPQATALLALLARHRRAGLGGPAGAGKTALAETVAASVGRAVWVELVGVETAVDAAAALGRALGASEPELVVVDQADTLDAEASALVWVLAAEPPTRSVLVVRRHGAGDARVETLVLPPVRRSRAVVPRLSAKEQRALEVLACSSGSVDAELALQAGADPEHLQALADRGLAVGRPGLRLPAPFRALVDPAPGVRAAFDLAVVERADGLAAAVVRGVGRSTFAALIPDLRRLLRGADPGLAARAALALSFWYRVDGPRPEARRVLGAVEARSEVLPHLLRGRLRLERAILEVLAGDGPAAAAAAREAVEALVAAGDPRRADAARLQLSSALSLAGDHVGAAAVAREAGESAARRGADEVACNAAVVEGVALFRAGDLEAAIAVESRGLTRAREAGLPLIEAALLVNRGSCCQHLGRHALAKADLLAAVQVATAAGAARTKAEALAILGAVALDLGEPARATFDAAAEVMGPHGTLVTRHTVRMGLALASVVEGDWARAEGELAALLLEAREAPRTWFTGLVRTWLALVRLVRGADSGEVAVELRVAEQELAGDGWARPRAWNRLAEVLRSLHDGAPETALDVLERAPPDPTLDPIRRCLEGRAAGRVAEVPGGHTPELDVVRALLPRP